jgi:septum formation protein
VSAPPAPPLLLASVSPQRRAILEQLRIPFDLVTPRYEEDDVEDDPVALVRMHALGKSRSVAQQGGDRPVLGVDTAVVVAGRAFGKPEGPEEAERMLETLSGRTHEVVSGLCLLTRAWEEVAHETTSVTFRTLTPPDIAHYLHQGEWRDRAGAYAIQGLGASLVETIDGDYLNVVGLPAALLVRILGERFAGVYGFG